jgi:beta-N-acetylglucosaminidase
MKRTITVKQTESVKNKIVMYRNKQPNRNFFGIGGYHKNRLKKYGEKFGKHASKKALEKTL